MDALDEYFDALDRLSDLCVKEGWSVDRLLESEDKVVAPLVQKCVRVRGMLIDATDFETFGGLLATGLFRDHEDNERIAYFALQGEILEDAVLKELKRSFESYRKDQPLFEQVPSLLQHARMSGERPMEMIDNKALKWDDTGQLACFGHTKARLSSYVSPRLLAWINTEFPNCRIFVRIEPYEVGPGLLARLNEEIIRPANPHWWKTLELLPGRFESAVYELQDRNPKEDLEQSWEYRVRKCGRLEVSFRRDGGNVLSGMIEELPRPGNDRFFLGRCIHFTSSSPVGTEWSSAQAEHIDAAMNVYVDGDVISRWASTLERGVVTNATFRTHVLRIDDVPLRALLPMADLFFQSRRLLNDWFSDQFRESLVAPAGNSPEPLRDTAPSPDAETDARG